VGITPKVYDMHIYRSGVSVTYPFSGKMKLLQPRISLPISLILVGFDSITDTGILYDIVKALHDTRRVPIEGRFRDTDDDKSFAKSIQLEGVGALYDMIRCLKRPNYPVVRAEMKKWLAYSDTQANKVMYLAW